MDSATFMNTIFYNNSAAGGSAVLSDQDYNQTCTFLFCDFVNNECTGGSEAYSLIHSSALNSLINCNIWGNPGSGYIMSLASYLSHCNVENLDQGSTLFEYWDYMDPEECISSSPNYQNSSQPNEKNGSPRSPAYFHNPVHPCWIQALLFRLLAILSLMLT
ncbi:MAG: hypothetical protein GF344_06980 [Chitinivibrionales bacterium]|nr:hypothetical protein [Chitinivibrionales bacterium]